MVDRQKVAVVIPNWNGADFIRPCLDSLAKQTCAHQVIVVDNGSVDDSVAIIQQGYSSVQLIKLPHNTGFAGGVNAGIKAAMAADFEYIALFNNDALAAPDWLERLVQAAQQHQAAGIVTGKFMRLEPKGTIDSTGDFYSVWGFPYPRGRDEVDCGQYDSGEWIFGATGGASLYRAELFKQVGLFDEAFFAYYEDVDLSFRAQLAGWKVRYQPQAVAYHHVGATSSRLSGFSRYHSYKNFYYLYLKNMPGWLFWRYLPRFWFGALLMTINTIRQGYVWPLAKASGRLIVTLPATISKRWHIQAKRAVDLGYIDNQLTRPFPPTLKSIHRLKARLGLR